MTGRVHVVATAAIGGRRLRFDAIFCQNRLRITMPRSTSGEVPGIASEDASGNACDIAADAATIGASSRAGLEALGSVVYLDSAKPGLRISSPLHVDWAAQHCAAIIAEAERIWTAVLRECDG